MPTDNRENPHRRAQRGVREIAPLPTGFRDDAGVAPSSSQLLHWLDDASTRWLAHQHENLAKAIDHRRQKQSKIGTLLEGAGQLGQPGGLSDRLPVQRLGGAVARSARPVARNSRPFSTRSTEIGMPPPRMGGDGAV
jgi:hypothetical protein